MGIVEREFLEYRTEWTTYHSAMEAFSRDYEHTRLYANLRAKGMEIEAFRYRYGWALYTVRKK